MFARCSEIEVIVLAMVSTTRVCVCVHIAEHGVHFLWVGVSFLGALSLAQCEIERETECPHKRLKQQATCESEQATTKSCPEYC